MRISRVIAGSKLNRRNVQRLEFFDYFFERKLRQQRGETSNSHERKRTTGNRIWAVKQPRGETRTSGGARDWQPGNPGPLYTPRCAGTSSVRSCGCWHRSAIKERSARRVPHIVRNSGRF